MNLTRLADTPARQRAMPSYLLAKTAALAGRRVGEALAAVGARIYHFGVLAALEEFGPASQAALERRTGIDRSDMVAVVNELASQGYVERTPDPVDRRRNVITVTPGGLAHLERMQTLLAQVQDDLFAPIDPGERAQLTALLERILDQALAGPEMGT